MDVKNTDNVTVDDKPKRNNNRNRNYNRNYSKNRKPESGESAENTQVNKTSSGSDKPANNRSNKPRYNKNYNGNKQRNSENVKNNENRNYNQNRNRNKNRRNSGISKTKSYYMSKSPSDEEFDEIFGDIFNNEDKVENVQTDDDFTIDDVVRNFEEDEKPVVKKTQNNKPKKKKKPVVKSEDDFVDLTETEPITDVDFSNFEEDEKPVVKTTQSNKPKKKKKTAEKSLKRNDTAIAVRKSKTAERTSKSTADEKQKEHTKENPNTVENRKKSETRFWVRMFSLAAIVPVYVAIVICMLVMPRSTVSNIEKRNLDTFPEFSWSDYWSGTYTANITHYFDDTVPFRDTLKQTGSQLLNFLGIKYNDVQVTGQMQIVNDTNSNEVSYNPDSSVSGKTSKSSGSDSSQTEATDSEEEKVTPKGQEIADGVYVNGVIVVYQDGHYRGMSMYGGGSGDEYVEYVNSFAEDLSGVKVYSMVDPTSSEFYTPLNFSDYNASQSDDIDSINSRLVNVKGINICPTLAKHVNETIYTRTDHHWMSLGAYYAAQAFAKEAGVSFKDIRDYEKKVVPGYVGTMYSFSENNANLLNDPEDFIYYVPKVKNYTVEYYDYSYNFVMEDDMFADTDVGNMYSTFIYGDEYTVKIKTEVKNGRKLCLVKDSYGDAIPPFLTGSFEEIYVVDMRYFELNLVDFVKEKGITDLLFSCCSYSAVGPNSDNLEVIRTMGGSVPNDNDEDEKEPVESKADDEDISQDDSTTVDDNNNDDILNNINVDDGQLGFIGNINDVDAGGDDDSGSGDDDYSGENYSYDEEYY